MTNNVQTPGGNTTTAGAVEQLAMARRIVARFYQGIRDHDYTQWVLEGHKDETTGVKIALAAIIETTEAAARMVDDDIHVIDAQSKISRKLRDGYHLKGPKP